jgi:hypothetical protein
VHYSSATSVGLYELTHFGKTKIGNLDLCRAIWRFLRQEDVL